MALGGKQARFRLYIFTDEGNDLLKVTLEPRTAWLWTQAPLYPLGGCVTLGMGLPSLALSPIEFPFPTLGEAVILPPPFSSPPPVLSWPCLCNLSWGCRGRGLPFAESTCQLSRCEGIEAPPQEIAGS